MFKIYSIILCIFILSHLYAIPIDSSKARIAAVRHLSRIDQATHLTISRTSSIQKCDRLLAYVYHLAPIGYIVISGDDELPPVLAYSTTSTFNDSSNQDNILEDIIIHDLELRINNLNSVPRNVISRHHEAWVNLFENRQQQRFQQWPPEGTTASGGWIKTQWTQSAPYNMFCPMDLVTGIRSLAGCPAIAMGQIVSYYASINGMSFTDVDDYHHIYAGNNYWIDDDFATYSFPSFPELNQYLQIMMHHYRYQEEITDSDEAALAFACGAAANQVFTSEGSGTFSVNQAHQAYLRFHFSTAQLLTEENAEMYTSISENIMNAMPVHLAIESTDQRSGHNVVVDGYNTNEFYHLNFGYASAYDGWYLLPDDLPFGFTMIEGAIVDIRPVQYIRVSPDTLIIPTSLQMNQPFSIAIQDVFNEAEVMIEDCLFDSSFAGITWVVEHDPFPTILTLGDSTHIVLIPQTQSINTGNLYQTNLRIILDNTAIDVPIQYQSAVINDDEHQTSISSILKSSNYPNPFSTITSISYELQKQTRVTLSIYNIKGELVNQLKNEFQAKGNHAYQWDGTDKKGRKLASGVYLYSLSAGKESITKKMILLK